MWKRKFSEIRALIFLLLGVGFLWIAWNEGNILWGSGTIMCFAFYVYYTVKNEKRKRSRMQINTAQPIQLPENSVLLCANRYWAFVQEDAFHLVGATMEPNLIDEKVILMEDILFFFREGENYPGMLDNGYLKEGISRVSIGIEQTDLLKTQLCFREDERDFTIELGYADYKGLKTLMPEKDIAAVSKLLL